MGSRVGGEGEGEEAEFVRVGGLGWMYVCMFGIVMGREIGVGLLDRDLLWKDCERIGEEHSKTGIQHRIAWHCTSFGTYPIPYSLHQASSGAAHVYKYVA